MSTVGGKLLIPAGIPKRFEFMVSCLGTLKCWVEEGTGGVVQAGMIHERQRALYSILSLLFHRGEGLFGLRVGFTHMALAREGGFELVDEKRKDGTSADLEILRSMPLNERFKPYLLEELAVRYAQIVLRKQVANDRSSVGVS